MRPMSPRGASVVATAAGVLFVASPLRAVWGRPGVPWWVPFALWLGLVGLALFVATRRDPQ